MILPSDMEDVVPVPGGDMCAKFQTGLTVNQVFYNWLADEYTEGGEFTVAYLALLKAALP